MVHVISTPAGGYTFAGRVPVALVYDCDAETARAIAHVGVGMLRDKPKRRQYATAEAAWAAVEAMGLERCANPACACNA